jgi:hypothetical protein
MTDAKHRQCNPGEGAPATERGFHDESRVDDLTFLFLGPLMLGSL